MTVSTVNGPLQITVNCRVELITRDSSRVPVSERGCTASGASAMRRSRLINTVCQARESVTHLARSNEAGRQLRALFGSHLLKARLEFLLISEKVEIESDVGFEKHRLSSYEAVRPLLFQCVL